MENSTDYGPRGGPGQGPGRRFQTTVDERDGYGPAPAALVTALRTMIADHYGTLKSFHGRLEGAGCKISYSELSRQLTARRYPLGPDKHVVEQIVDLCRPADRDRISRLYSDIRGPDVPPADSFINGGDQASQTVVLPSIFDYPAGLAPFPAGVPGDDVSPISEFPLVPSPFDVAKLGKPYRSQSRIFAILLGCVSLLAILGLTGFAIATWKSLLKPQWLASEGLVVMTGQPRQSYPKQEYSWRWTEFNGSSIRSSFDVAISPIDTAEGKTPNRLTGSLSFESDCPNFEAEWKISASGRLVDQGVLSSNDHASSILKPHVQILEQIRVPTNTSELELRASTTAPHDCQPAIVWSNPGVTTG